MTHNDTKREFNLVHIDLLSVILGVPSVCGLLFRLA